MADKAIQFQTYKTIQKTEPEIDAERAESVLDSVSPAIETEPQPEPKKEPEPPKFDP